jgi:hypothetical protein
MYVGTKYKEERRIREKRKKEGSRLCGRCYCNPPNFNSDFGGAKVRNIKILPVDEVQYSRVCST